ncbi:MAG: ATP-binding protein [Oligoflexia bacterium]|nr:ATP-binding protein [Oligoflexia bacterium]
MRLLKGLTPLRIAGFYALVAFLWIYFSDSAVSLMTSDPETITRIQTFKGTFYVLATSLMLYALIERYFRQIRASEHRLKTLLECLPEAIIVVNREDQVVELNRSATLLFGLGRNEILTRTSLLRKSIALRPAQDPDPIARALAGETIYNWEGQIRAPGNDDLPISISASPVRDEPVPHEKDGSTGRAIIVFRSIAEIKRLERMRDEFLSTAAHELKSPMTTIKAYVQLLKKWRPAGIGERELKALSVLSYQTDRMNKLIQDLLEFSRLQLGRLQLNKTRFELRSLVSELVAQMQGISPTHRLSLADGPPEWVFADRDRVEQVLLNLVDNAIKFSPQGGAIEVTVSGREGEVCVAVKDQGIGIPPERQLQLFDRYYRAHAGTGHAYSTGMGMGLFISRELITRHGGRIWCQSRENAGSTFQFSIPISPEAARPAGGGERSAHEA